MCRWIAYRGRSVFLETVIVQPAHSLIHQSLHAAESKTGTNGDGFGVGWYGEKPAPGLYREVRPAWSDENLRSLCGQVRSPLFFAHVRASTGTATSRANCHPFVEGEWMFMHNGQIGCFHQLRRHIEGLIPDDLYLNRAGSTDSEAIFLAALARMKTMDPVAAIASVLADVKALMQKACVCEPLRFTAALTNGRDIYAFRWACDDKAPTLYWRIKPKGLFIVSEPFDNERQNWQAMPQASVLIARAGEEVAIGSLDLQLPLAA